MADTIGSLVDKLATTNTKLFLSQELLYDIRRMRNFSEFKETFLDSEHGGRKLWDTLTKLSDLNLQRTALVNEVDAKVIEMIRAGVAGQELDNGANIQRAHKTL